MLIIQRASRLAKKVFVVGIPGIQGPFNFFFFFCLIFKFCTGNTTIKVLNDEEIESMRVSCKLGREVLDEAAKAIEVGVTTDEIDRVVHEACIERECYPSPLNYYKFPASCCTSVNEVICHGIPDTRPLEVRQTFPFVKFFLSK